MKVIAVLVDKLPINAVRCDRFKLNIDWGEQVYFWCEITGEYRSVLTDKLGAGRCPECPLVEVTNE